MPDPQPNQQGEEASVDRPSLAVLETALWQRLNDAGKIDDLAVTWLALQCSMIGRVSHGMVRIVGRDGAINWPEAGREDADLHATADMVMAERRPIARGGSNDTEPAVAVPVMIGERIAAVVALRLLVSPGAQVKEELRSAIRQLQWGSAWLRERLIHPVGSSASAPAPAEAAMPESSKRPDPHAALDLIAAVLEHERFGAAAMAAATELAIRYDCARVSIGFRRGGSVRVAAISHTAQFGRRMRLVRAISAAMDEAVDQRCTILYPVGHDQAIASLAHEALSRVQHDGPVLTIPMFVIDRFIGAFTFERAKNDPFDPKVVALLDVIVTAVAPILEEKRLNDRLLVVKAWEALVQQAKRLLGPNYVGRKLVAAAALAAAAFLSFAADTYRVNADAQIEGSVRRAVVSSYDGYIQDAKVRAGETVKAGETLATLEDRELALERLRWATERQQRVFEHDQALATRQPAVINVIKSQIDQADAQIRLLDEQIARTRLVAPFDGLVVSGDLSQRIGTSVSRGEVLFEIAPLTDYRVVMQVDERQVADVADGQTGEVVFTSLPEEGFGLVVEKVTPVARPKDGRNVFQVEGRLTQSSERLRPGMIGVAKIDIGERKLVWIWLRPAIDWLRLASWRWLD